MLSVILTHILGSIKKGRPLTAHSCFDFISTMNACNLTCLDAKGALYTWSNNRRGINRVDIHLDRSFCNQAAL